MTVFENIKKISKKRGLSLQDVAIKSGLSKNMIYQYKNGAKTTEGVKRRAIKPSDETLKRIGDTLNVPFLVLKLDEINDLYMETGHPSNNEELLEMYKQAKSLKNKLNTHSTVLPIKSGNIIKVPVVGTIAMGTPITAEENIEGYVSEYFPGVVPSGELFELHCQGHSMEPTIPDGAMALIRKQPDVEDDEIAAVLIDGEATLKRVQHQGGQLILLPDNKDYGAIILNQERPGRILGKLIRYTVDF